MALFAQSHRVLLVSPVAPLRVHIPRAPAGRVVVVPKVPRIVVNI
jgi:hypothetical protein